MDSIDDIERIDDSCVHVIRGSGFLCRVLSIVEREVGRCLIGSPIRIAHRCFIPSDDVVPTII